MRRVLLALLLVPAPLFAQATEQNDDLRTITVDATGTVEREPEQALLLLAVESEAPTAAEASRANAERMESLLAALRRLQLEDDDIRTTAYDLSPIYQRPGPQRDTVTPRIVAYRARNMVQVEVDTVSRVGAVIDGAVEAGANRVAGLTFQLRDPEEARLEALEDALASARREAEALAVAAGVTLGPAQSIQTSGGGRFPPPMPMYRGVAMDAAQMETPIEGGTLTVSAHVVVVYRIAPQ
ncbi:MAG: SIMPL domain-containing protein [Longimicrobiales bacterium]